MELHDVVRKLVGPIEPVGDSNIDRQRFENIKAMTELIDRLLFDIYQVAPCADRHEDSMKKIGNHARRFLREVKEAD